MKLGNQVKDGLVSLGNSLETIYRSHIEYERESQNIGWMSDEDKVRLLKYGLYQSTSGRGNPEHLKQLRLTIQLLSKEIDRERKHRYSLPVFLNEVSKVLISLGILATIGSYVTLPFCGNSRSNFCNDARKIPQRIERYFADEPKSQILPANLGN